MEKISRYQKLATETIVAIDGENLTSLDFDGLKETLVEIALLLEESRKYSADLRLLRQDYTARISGMEKAIAIAKRGRERMQSAMELIDALDSMSASELIAQYTRSQARFKDAFPTSFGFLHRKQPAQPARDMDDYK